MHHTQTESVCQTVRFSPPFSTSHATLCSMLFCLSGKQLIVSSRPVFGRGSERVIYPALRKMHPRCVIMRDSNEPEICLMHYAGVATFSDKASRFVRLALSFRISVFLGFFLNLAAFLVS